MAACTAKSKRTGKPCGRPAIVGGTVCFQHGGGAPQTRDAARRRLLEAADPVAAELVRLATQADSESVRAQAARDILDRAGYGAKQQIEQQVTTYDGDSDLDRSIAELVEKLARPRQSRTPMATDSQAEPAST